MVLPHRLKVQSLAYYYYTETGIKIGSKGWTRTNTSCVTGSRATLTLLRNKIGSPCTNRTCASEFKARVATTTNQGGIINKLVHRVGNAPTRIVRVRTGCPSIVASDAWNCSFERISPYEFQRWDLHPNLPIRLCCYYTTSSFVSSGILEINYFSEPVSVMTWNWCIRWELNPHVYIG